MFATLRNSLAVLSLPLATLVLTLIFTLASRQVRAADVLIIYDYSVTYAPTVSLKNALLAAGHSVTFSSVPETGWNNTNPSLSAFDVVIHLNGTTYATAMPSAGQTALKNFVQSGGGLYVGFEWSAYEVDQLNTMTAMQDLVLLSRTSGASAPASYTVISSQSSHPVLANVASSFTILHASNNQGGLRTFSTQPSTALVMEGTNVGVAIRDFGTGHVLCFNTAANYNAGTSTENQSLANTNIQRIILNFIDTYTCVNIAGTVTNVACTGNSTGAISTTISNGTTPYAYSWNTGATTSSISGLTAGSYTVTVADNTGCTSTRTFTVTQPLNALNFSLSSSNITCNGGTNGAITSLTTGGTPSYSYQWNNGATTSALSNLSAGTYSVTVTDQNGCSVVSGTTITQPGAFLASAITTNVTCNGFGDGSAQASASGGTLPYSYVWSTGSTSATISNLSAGTYFVTVTDQNGCSDAETVVINNPPPFSASIASSTNVSCYGQQTGSASVSASGGQSPYTYAWSSGATGASLTQVAAGTYTVTVTDYYGCTDTDVITISQPNTISATLNSTNTGCSTPTGSVSAAAAGGTGPYTYAWTTGATTSAINGLSGGTYTVTITDVSGCTASFSSSVSQSGSLNISANTTSPSCFGSSNGAISASATGSGSSFSYAWNTGATSSTITNLSAGSYQVTVTANDGCVSTQQVTVSQPAVVSASMLATNNSCGAANSGSATATATGGTSPYSYLWSTGGTNAAILNVGAGTYTVTVTDNHGCTDVESINIVQSTALTASVSSANNLSCYNISTGSITLNVSGSTTPYTYAWSNGSSAAALTAVGAGTYTVTVTSNSGCTATASATLTQPTQISIPTLSRVNISCNGGSNGALTASPTGGTSPYTYTWSNGAGTATNMNLGMGTYTVTVTDNNGCTRTASRPMVQPTVVNMTASATQVSCYNGANGSAVASTTGGVGPYTYQWSTGGTTSTINALAAGTYFVTCTDNNGCTDVEQAVVAQPSPINTTLTATSVTCNGGSNGALTTSVTGGTSPYGYTWNGGATGSTRTGLTSGTYTVTITDNNGCTAVQSSTVTQPSPFVAQITATNNLLCNGSGNGSAIATATGGTTPYSYLWNNLTTTALNASLQAGTYTVTATDNQGCTSTATTTVSQPNALTVSGSVSTAISCNGLSNGQLLATAIGGTPGYGYAWSNGSSTAANSGLSAGSYGITVTDANGCTTANVVNLSQPSTLNATVGLINNVSCSGGANGSATAGATGGTTPYTYTWSTGSTSAALNSITAGAYQVTVSDNNGCTDTENVTITQPTPLVSAISSSTNVLCNGGSNGSATASATGGTSPYTYAWSVGGTSATRSSLGAGSYTVTVTDNHGCTNSSAVSISEPSVLSASTASGTDVSCFGGNNGTASANVTGGTSPYSYLWNNGSTNASATSVAAGTYTVTVTDDHGCTATTTSTVAQPPALLISVNADDVLCNGGNTGAASATASGGVAPYAFLWSTSANTASLSSLFAGTYTVTVTDNNNCTASVFTIISEPDSLLSTTTVSSVLCFDGSDGSITANPTGGTTPYAYAWSTNATTATAGALTAGTYSVTITDNNGCSTTNSATVTQPTALIGSLIIDQSPSCFGFDDGMLSYAVSGGTLPYDIVWSNAQNGSSATQLIAGNYTVIATDSAGCFIQDSVTLTEPTPLSLNFTNVVNVSCHGQEDGSVVAAAAGATPPYQYDWSNGNTTAQNTLLGAGTYILVLTDSQACTLTDSIVISEPEPLSLTMDSAAANCYIGTDGWAAALVEGGTLPYAYSWNTGDTTDTLIGQPNGQYHVVITDSQGCIIQDSVSIEYLHDLPVVDLGEDSVFCDTIDTELNAANIGAKYLWSTGATSMTIAIQQPGTYWVEVENDFGCVQTDTIYFELKDCLGIDDFSPAFAFRLYPNPTRSTCYLEAQGSSFDPVDIHIFNATGQLIWQHSADRMSASERIELNFENKPAGMYYVSVAQRGQRHVQAVVVQ